MRVKVEAKEVKGEALEERSEDIVVAVEAAGDQSEVF